MRLIFLKPFTLADVARATGADLPVGRKRICDEIDLRLSPLREVPGMNHLQNERGKGRHELTEVAWSGLLKGPNHILVGLRY